MVTCTIEPLAYLWDHGLEELTRRAYEEVVKLDGIFNYDPDWERYQEMERNNNLRFFALRTNHILCGYAAVIIENSLIDRTKRVAVVHSIYVLPEHRAGMLTGPEFILCIEKQLYDIKTDVIIIAEPQNKIGKVYSKMGFIPQETMWAKVLRGETG